MNKYKSIKNYNKCCGSINKKTNIYEFPTLYHFVSKNNIREWSIFIRLINKKNKIKLKFNWKINYDESLPIEKKYFTN